MVNIFLLNYKYFLRNIGSLVQAWWQSGYAEDCKSFYAGSIPTQASKIKYPLVGIFILKIIVYSAEWLGSRMLVRLRSHYVL